MGYGFMVLYYIKYIIVVYIGTIPQPPAHSTGFGKKTRNQISFEFELQLDEPHGVTPIWFYF
tara:strand:- start:634 stop:819 length:186 start_codon:yes stop_codon:yes gene_type:complete